MVPGAAEKGDKPLAKRINCGESPRESRTHALHGRAGTLGWPRVKIKETQELKGGLKSPAAQPRLG